MARSINLETATTEAITKHACTIHSEVREMEARLEMLRERRARAFQALKDRGVSNYQIGNLVGITNVAVLQTLRRLKAS